MRKLLLHKKEIAKLDRESDQAGVTIVPLSMYFRDGYAKVEIAVAQGKREYDKRATIAARDAEREMARAFSSRLKGRRSRA